MRRALLAALMLSGCVRATPAAAPLEDPSLLTALFLDARSMEPQLANDFACAGIENAGTEEDPPTSVLALLRQRLGSPVIPQSACRRDERTSLVVAEGQKGSGTWLTIGGVGCDRVDRCTATVSYYVANQGAGGRDVIAERTGSGWRIIPTGRMWIS
jgi:hypothetical protein